VVKFGTTAVTIANNDSKWMRIGRLVIVDVAFRIGTHGGGTGTFYVSAPVAPRGYGTFLQPYMRPVGRLNAITVPGGTVVTADANWEASSSQVYFRTTTAAITHNSPVTWAVNDDFQATLWYQAAADA
jgi:hypothetical protein